MIPLSRTCRLKDFPDCITVAAWQQELAHAAWTRWVEERHVQTRTPNYCVNWSGCPFQAPGPTAIYQLRGEPIPPLPQNLPAVFALSVLDHLDAPLRFLVDALAQVRVGGLLFLTYAFWNAEGPDLAAGNGERRRIYDATSQRKLLEDARKLDLVPFGGLDRSYHGHTLDDHTLASLVLTRRRKGDA